MSDNTFNYFEALNNSQTSQWTSQLNSAYINLTGTPCLIYKLDKVKTPIDDLYNETSTSRIYLPPFQMKLLHLINAYTQNLGTNYLYSEPDANNIQFVVNFQEMVAIIRDLKASHICDIEISYKGSGSAFVENVNDVLRLWINCAEVAQFDLKDNECNTVQKLVNKINQISNFSAKYTGKNDASENIVNFSKTRIRNKTLKLYVPDTVYKNCTDIIEKGDIIIDSTARAYQVNQNLFSNNNMWSYQTMVLDCSKIKVDYINLPGNYIQQIHENRFGLKKIKKE